MLGYSVGERQLQKNKTIFHIGDEFRSLYALRAGSVKLVSVSENGEEQITGFFLPGETFGMDGIASNAYKNYAIAINTSTICEIPFGHLQILMTKLPYLQRRFFELMSEEIGMNQQMISWLNKKDAEERVVAFLSNLSLRYQRLGNSFRIFNLPMSQVDIANILGLRVETVCRVFSRLKKCNPITLNKNSVE